MCKSHIQSVSGRPRLRPRQHRLGVAETNFPVADYRAEWAELEALGVNGAVALMQEHAAAEQQEVMNKASRFRGASPRTRG